MLRSALITAITFAALAPTSSALADELCMSAPASTQGVSRPGMSRQGLPPTWTQLRESLDVGPFFSSDGMTLISSGELDELFRVHEVEHRERAPLSEILWCWSGDDPNCSPTTPPRDAPHALQAGHRAIPVDMFGRWPALEDGGRPPRGALQGGPREGVRNRVERPPRG